MLHFIYSITPPPYEDLLDMFMENITQFAVRNSILGGIMFILSYVAIAAFDYSAKRQVITKWLNGNKILNMIFNLTIIVT
jgi:small-conductance mechanosensitive channel